MITTKDLSALREEILKQIFSYDEKVISSIVMAFGGDIRDILLSLIKPPERLYMRVNILRTTREEVIEHIEREGYRAYADETLDEAIYIPIEGPYEIEPLGERVVADKRASEAVMMGSNLYSPGVISCERVRKGDTVHIVSENGFLLAVGRAIVNCEEALRSRRGVFIEVEKSIYRSAPIRELRVWREGLIYPQSLPSMIASRMLDPKPGDVVIDMCAAPGGKSGHIFELSRGMATIHAIDHSIKRIEEMRENLRRLGYLDKINIHRLDARYISKDLAGVRPNKIMLDPPCSSTGVKPKLWHRITWKDLESLRKYQIQFIEEAHRSLVDKGILVYSTCSITYEENELIIEETLEKGLFDIIEPPYWVKKISNVSRIGWIRFDPRKGGPGFFIAILRKRGASRKS